MNQQKAIEFQDDQKQHGAIKQSGMELTEQKTDQKGAIENCKTLFLLFEMEQFEKFEHWIRMGLIYVDFQNSSGKLDGLAKVLGAIPVSSKPVNFDVLVQVTLPQNDYSKIEWCDTDNELGWLSPGIMPINRMKCVQFPSMSILESTSNLLKNGSVVPEVLNAYQTRFEWTVADLTDESFSEERVISILKTKARQPKKIDVEEKIRDWDKNYGQLSFFRSLSEGFPNITLLTHVIIRITKLLGTSWKALEKMLADVEGENCSKPDDFYSSLDIRDEMLAYYNDVNAPEMIENLSKNPDFFARKLGEFIENADLRWGKVVSENQPVKSSFEVIEQLNSDSDVDHYLFTQAILALSQSAHRLNLNSFGDPQSTARTRNFQKGNEWVYMTSLPTDSINTFLSECCFSAIKEEDFDENFWLNHLELSKDSVIDLTESQVMIFGVKLKRNLSSSKATKMFLQWSKKLREENESLKSKMSEMRDEMGKQKKKLDELSRLMEKGQSLISS